MALLLTLLTSADTCSAAQLAELLAPADATAPVYTLRCNATLTKADKITKRIVIAGAASSGVTLDCAGGVVDPWERTGYTIAIQSTFAGEWSRPENVTIRGCTVFGNIRIYGMAKNGEGEALKESSHSAGHTERAQAAAPRNTLLERVSIVGIGNRSPLYIAPGVTETTLIDSEISGSTSGPAVYLDAESAHSTLTRSYIHAVTESRELIAVDGSAYNTISDNRLSALNHGGIYLYRNCGEGGTVRHQAPQYNVISDNVFFYDEASAVDPSIWLGSRQGLRGYCDLDDGYPFGSSESNGDHARHNVIARNQIYRLAVSLMIRELDSPNTIADNITINPRHGIGCGGREREELEPTIVLRPSR